ncbi:E3 ubiquitin-protein ligase CCNB1IP1-like [Cyprinus carpio]|uniref:E3 ubiquitin-protein ligase CCNB1IP1-like n=1 Tax=Cyprinus carpio TaxID=7962 RepID=A0A9Q9WFX4_CYPCA|nr:E3 ubiquitin-protein ligase CCNB1IP1-like [Cyprinus carpio]
MSASKFTLLCNSNKCRSKLSGFTWVTACSHVFCDQHGSEAFSRTPATCPACSSMLSGKLDVFRIELAPSEQYKAMVLVRLQPETVLEISHKALDFWATSVLTFNFYILQVLEEYKRRHNEVLERLNEQNRQYQKLQGLLDSLRMHTLGKGEKDPISHPFTTGLVKQRSPHSSPSFPAPEGDRFFSLGPENAKTFFQFSTPT